MLRKHRILSIGNRHPVRLACETGALFTRFSANEAQSERGARGTGEGAFRLPSLT